MNVIDLLQDLAITLVALALIVHILLTKPTDDRLHQGQPPMIDSDFRTDVWTPGGVAILHIPTGMRESCDESPDMAVNRTIAMARLHARLLAKRASES